MRDTSALLALAALTVGCAGARPFPRETHAPVAQSDDPWIAGERCSNDSPAAGLRIEELEPGTGRPVGRGDTVRVHYVARVAGGVVLHDSHERNVPSEVIIGSTRTICGFERALVGMTPGAERRVFVPWALGFGEQGRAPDVPPRTDLVFEIELYLPTDSAYVPGSAPVNPSARGRVQ